jgi:hypothetical protein
MTKHDIMAIVLGSLMSDGDEDTLDDVVVIDKCTEVISAAIQNDERRTMSAAISKRTPNDEHWFNHLASNPSNRSNDAEMVQMIVQRVGFENALDRPTKAKTILAYPSKLGMYN